MSTPKALGDGGRGGTPAGPPLTPTEREVRLEAFRTYVTALNKQFLDWCGKQWAAKPTRFWSSGMRDYLRHQAKIRLEFGDMEAEGGAGAAGRSAVAAGRQRPGGLARRSHARATAGRGAGQMHRRAPELASLLPSLCSGQQHQRARAQPQRAGQPTQVRATAKPHALL